MSLLVIERAGKVASLSKAEQICRLVTVIVVSRYKLPVSVFNGKSRRCSEAVEARHVAMYLAYTIFGVTQQDIADVYDCDRTTVTHACHAVEDRRDDKNFEDLIIYLELVLVEFISIMEAA